jgi:hypothetical protein
MNLDTMTLVLRDPSGLARRILASPATLPDLLSLLCCSAALLALYGLMMGVRGGYKQMAASMAKTPILFGLTLVICMPVLYMINVLLGSSMDLPRMATLMLAGLAMTSLVLTSFAPIVGFFGVSSEYQFMKLAHVGVFGLGALAGVASLAGGMKIAAEMGLLAPRSGQIAFNLWIGVYAFVGCQMAWFLRPFLGDPNLPFQFLRKPEPGMNFYVAVLKAFRIVRGSSSGSEASRWAKDEAPRAAEASSQEGSAEAASPA